MTKRPEPVDPFEKFREQGALVFDVPVPEGFEAEVAARWSGRTFPSWKCVKAQPMRGAVIVVYFTDDQRIRDNFASPNAWGWPADLVMTAQTTVGAIQGERAEQAE